MITEKFPISRTREKGQNYEWDSVPEFRAQGLHGLAYYSVLHIRKNPWLSRTTLLETFNLKLDTPCPPASWNKKLPSIRAAGEHVEQCRAEIKVGNPDIEDDELVGAIFADEQVLNALREAQLLSEGPSIVSVLLENSEWIPPGKTPENPRIKTKKRNVDSTRAQVKPKKILRVSDSDSDSAQEVEEVKPSKRVAEPAALAHGQDEERCKERVEPIYDMDSSSLYASSQLADTQKGFNAVRARIQATGQVNITQVDQLLLHHDNMVAELNYKADKREEIYILQNAWANRISEDVRELKREQRRLVVYVNNCINQQLTILGAPTTTSDPKKDVDAKSAYD